MTNVKIYIICKLALEMIIQFFTSLVNDIDVDMCAPFPKFDWNIFHSNDTMFEINIVLPKMKWGKGGGGAGFGYWLT